MLNSSERSSSWGRSVILVILFICSVSFISYKASHALFSDTATSTGNVFTVSEFSLPPPGEATSTPTATSTSTPTPTSSPTPTPTPSLHLVINEVFEDGNNNNEWVELFNPGDSEIDVSGWSISDAVSSDTLPTVSPIPAGGYAVIIACGSVTVPVSAITILLNSFIGSGLNVSGDAVILKDLTDISVDQMSYGNNTDVFPSPPSAPGQDESLIRSPNGVDTDTAGDWDISSTPSIGVAN